MRNAELKDRKLKTHMKDRGQKIEFGIRNAECGIKGQKTKDTHEGQRTENRNGELGMRNGEVGMLRLGILECGLNLKKICAA
jgi:hypothetical protein